MRVDFGNLQCTNQFLDQYNGVWYIGGRDGQVPWEAYQRWRYSTQGSAENGHHSQGARAAGKYLHRSHMRFRMVILLPGHGDL